MKKTFFYLSLIFLLGACSDVKNSVSYQIGEEQAITLVRMKDYPWDDEYMRSVVVMSMPKCTLRYKMPPDNGEIGNVTLYDSGDGYYVLKDKAGQYTANLADCSMTVVEKNITDPGEFKGTFEMIPDQPPRFVAAPPKPKVKAPVAAPAPISAD